MSQEGSKHEQGPGSTVRKTAGSRNVTFLKGRGSNLSVTSDNKLGLMNEEAVREQIEEIRQLNETALEELKKEFEKVNSKMHQVNIWKVEHESDIRGIRKKVDKLNVAVNKETNKKEEEEKDFINMIADETVDTPIRPKEMVNNSGVLHGLSHLHHNQGSNGPQLRINLGPTFDETISQNPLAERLPFMGQKKQSAIAVNHLQMEGID